MIPSLMVFVGFLFAVVTLPGTVALLIWTVAAWLPRRSFNFLPGRMHKIVTLIPACNEAAGIKETIESIKKADCPIIVIADNCTDNTAAIATSCGARVYVRTDPYLKGKHHALRFAFSLLEKEPYTAYLIVDGDTIVEPQALSAVAQAFSYGATCVQLQYRYRNYQNSLWDRLQNIGFNAFNLVRPLGRSALHCSCGIFGNGFCVTKTELQEVPFAMDSVVEDAAYHIKLVLAGHFVTFVDTAAVLAPIAPAASASGQRVRWEGGRLRLARETVIPLFQAVLKGNWRAIEPLVDLCVLPLSYHTVGLFLTVFFFPAYAVFGFFVILFHLLTAWIKGKGDIHDLMALVAAPFYCLWKLQLLGKIIAGAKLGAAWVKTERQ